jgi:hypothetical protein
MCQISHLFRSQSGVSGGTCKWREGETGVSPNISVFPFRYYHTNGQYLTFNLPN